EEDLVGLLGVLRRLELILLIDDLPILLAARRAVRAAEHGVNLTDRRVHRVRACRLPIDGVDDFPRARWRAAPAASQFRHRRSNRDVDLVIERAEADNQ